MKLDYEKVVEITGPYALDSDGAWWFCWGDDDPVMVRSPKNHITKIFAVLAICSVAGVFVVLEVLP